MGGGGGGFERFWLVKFFGWPTEHNSCAFSLDASIMRSGGPWNLYGDARCGPPPFFMRKAGEKGQQKREKERRNKRHRAVSSPDLSYTTRFLLSCNQ